MVSRIQSLIKHAVILSRLLTRIALKLLAKRPDRRARWPATGPGRL